jgi:hypothetical protein
MSEMPVTDKQMFRKMEGSFDIVILLTMRDLDGDREELSAYVGGRNKHDHNAIDRLWAWSESKVDTEGDEGDE